MQKLKGNFLLIECWKVLIFYLLNISAAVRSNDFDTFLNVALLWRELPPFRLKASENYNSVCNYVAR